jgi:molybdate transport system substrate-binding protein
MTSSFRVAITVILFIAPLFPLSGCGSSQKPAADNDELIVSAAVSLKDAFNEIAELYRKQTNAIVRFNFGASGTLQKQIESGAPVDVFASAGAKQMDQLASKGVIDATTRKDFAGNHLVLIVLSARSGISSFSDLSKAEVKKIAAGNPKTVPAGQYTEQTLTQLKLLPQIQPKLIYAEDVRQVLDYVIRDEVDAGVVYSSDAQVAGDKVRVAAQAPDDSHDRILYPIAVLKESRKRDAARKFIDLVLSSEGQSILAKQGFVSEMR